MPKQNRKPGIHLHKTKVSKIYSDLSKPEYYWILIAKNGKTIAEGRPYKRKRSAVKSIEIASEIFDNKWHFYDHTSGGVGMEEVTIN